ncbi:hypothetical protein LTR53_000519 [Teratosphaeriaceae sp. CCFEE 6253]|nr:hypothetical protein LTR53_000519 [Teratosphaeriaceae sp. CCFEE 6253]
MPVTEVLVSRLVQEDDVRSADNPAGSSVEACVDRLREQTGYQRLTAGMQLEHPDALEALINYGLTDREAWEAPQSQRELQQWLDRAQVDHGDAYHVDFSPFHDFELATASPVTEVARFYFNGPAPAHVLAGFTKFGEALNAQLVAGLRGVAAGLTQEDVEYEGVRGRAVMLVMGWLSVEDHVAFKETQLFKDAVKLLPVAEAGKIEMHHTRFQTFG